MGKPELNANNFDSCHKNYIAELCAVSLGQSLTTEVSNLFPINLQPA